MPLINREIAWKQSLYNDLFTESRKNTLRMWKTTEKWHFAFFFDFSAREVYIGILFYLRMARAVFEGTNMVNAKGSNGNF